MTPIIEQLFASIEKAIPKLFSKMEKREPHWVSHQVTLDELCLSELNLHLPLYPKVYLYSKNTQESFLGLNSLDLIYEKKQIFTIENKIKKNKDLIYLGAHRFDTMTQVSTKWFNFKECYFFLPQVLLKRGSKGELSLTLYGNKNLKQCKNPETYFFTLWQSLWPKAETCKNEARFKDISHATWTKQVNQIKKYLSEDSQIKKIVSATEKEVFFNTNIEQSQLSLLTNSHQAHGHYHFELHISPRECFISLSPETLFFCHQNKLSLDALAGTRRRYNNQDKDERMKKELLNDNKEVKEHKFVVDDICHKLRQLIPNGIIHKDESIHELSYVQHKKTSISIALEKIPSFNDLLSLFHPTPAVGSFPTHYAHQLINKIEGFDRGYYAGPFGVISNEGYDIGVAIRSFLVQDNRLTFFVGAGIVEESDPESEYCEIINKLNAFKHFWEHHAVN